MRQGLGPTAWILLFSLLVLARCRPPLRLWVARPVSAARLIVCHLFRPADTGWGARYLRDMRSTRI